MITSSSSSSSSSSSTYYLYTLWFISFIFAFTSILISVIGIKEHLTYLTKPIIQHKIIGILLMVPVYATTSWLSLLFINHSMYLDMIRDTYESFVIYTFFSLTYCYITNIDDNAYLLDHNKIIKVLEDKAYIRHLPPISYFMKPINRTILLVTSSSTTTTSSRRIIRIRSSNILGYNGDGEDVMMYDDDDIISNNNNNIKALDLYTIPPISLRNTRSDIIINDNNINNINNNNIKALDLYTIPPISLRNTRSDIIINDNNINNNNNTSSSSSSLNIPMMDDGGDNNIIIITTGNDGDGGGREIMISNRNEYNINLWYPRTPKEFLISCKTFVLQFLIVKPLTTIIALLLHNIGLYEEGNFSLINGYIYICICVNISISISLYWLIMFYIATKKSLEPYKPVPKFLCIKAILFASFWQSVILNILVEFGLLSDIPNWSYNSINVKTSLQNTLICIEMLIASILHRVAFTVEPYKDMDEIDNRQGEAAAAAQQQCNDEDITHSTTTTTTTTTTTCSSSSSSSSLLLSRIVIDNNRHGISRALQHSVRDVVSDISQVSFKNIIPNNVIVNKVVNNKTTTTVRDGKTSWRNNNNNIQKGEEEEQEEEV